MGRKGRGNKRRCKTERKGVEMYWLVCSIFWAIQCHTARKDGESYIVESKKLDDCIEIFAVNLIRVFCQDLIEMLLLFFHFVGPYDEHVSNVYILPMH